MVDCKRLTTVVEVGKIDEAIEMATGLKCTTSRAQALLKAASVVQSIRLALKYMEWEALSTILKEIDYENIINDIAEEVAIAKDESNNYVVINELETSIRSTQVSGQIGYLDTSKINLIELSKVVSLANRLGCKTEKAKRLEHTAQYAMEVREYVLDGDWVSTRTLVDKYEELNAKSISSVGTTHSTRNMGRPRQDSCDIAFLADMAHRKSIWKYTIVHA